jgi:hypothetical protein
LSNAEINLLKEKLEKRKLELEQKGLTGTPLHTDLIRDLKCVNYKLEPQLNKTSKDQIEISTSEIIKSEDPAMQHMFDNMAFGSSKNKIPIIDK